MMYQYFNDLAAGLQAKIDENPEKTNARKKYVREVAKLGSRLYSENQSIAWCGICVPFDLLNVMGVTSCFVEFVGALMATNEIADHSIVLAEQAGYASDTCAYHRSVTGAFLENILPVPDFVIGTSSPCTAGLTVMENMARVMKKDLFVLNVPQIPTDQNVRYLADQIRDLVSFISDHTGQALDKERLKEAVQKTNQTRSLLLEIYDYAAMVPSPVNSKLLRDFGIVLPLFFGTDGVIEVCKAYRDELKGTIDSKKSGIEDEKIRLMWIQNRIQFKTDIDNMLEEEFHANIVIDELNTINWGPIDPEDPYEGFARRIISLPIGTDIEHRMKHMKDLAEKYKIVGAINPCHWGCRQGTGSRGMIGKGMKEIGIPVLNLEVDCVDSRNFAPNQVRTRIEAFMEMLENQ